MAKVLNLHCHERGKRPNLTRSAIWIFNSCLTLFLVHRSRFAFREYPHKEDIWQIQSKYIYSYIFIHSCIYLSMFFRHLFPTLSAMSTYSHRVHLHYYICTYLYMYITWNGVQATPEKMCHIKSTRAGVGRISIYL